MPSRKVKHRCVPCNRKFYTEYTYQKHRNSAQCFANGNRRRCKTCKISFATPQSLERHVERHHPFGSDRRRFSCGICPTYFKSREQLQKHREMSHVKHHDFRITKTAHRRQTINLRCFFPKKVKTVSSALFHTFRQAKKLIESLKVEMDYFKCNLVMTLEMAKLGPTGDLTQVQAFPFRGYGVIVSPTVDFQEDLAKTCGDIERNVDEFTFRGSGWFVRRPLYLESEVVQCEPLSGACGLHVVSWKHGRGIEPTVDRLMEKGNCFYLAVASFFCGQSATKTELEDFVKHQLQPQSKEKEMRVDRIEHFEEINEVLDLAVNVVYQDANQSVYPVRASKNVEAKNIVVLLLFFTASEEEKEKEMTTAPQKHYALIRDPQRLLAKRTLDARGSTRTSSVYICWNCFNVMKIRSAYISHVAFCHKNNSQIITMPEKGEVREFDESKEEDARKSFESAFILFFDFEALQIPPQQACNCSARKRQMREEWDAMTEEEKQDYLLEQRMKQEEEFLIYEAQCFDADCEGRQRPAPSRRWMKDEMCAHKTHTVFEQPPFAYSLVLADRDLKVRKEKVYVGEDAACNFVESVLDIADEFLPSLTPGEKMLPMTEEELEEVRSTVHCYLCGEEMDDGDRVRDHDHLNGMFLGVAHNVCNLRRREQSVLTCYAHNFSGYDSHFLVKAFNQFPTRINEIFAIPLNTQKFKYMSINRRIKFADSFAFLPDSLAKLVETLKSAGSSFPLLKQMEDREEGRELLLKKGVFPYEFCTSIERLRNQHSLPLKEEFFSKLSGKEATEEDYEHALKVWNFFQCGSMLDYTVIYVRTDVFQLADVMMHFRKDVWKNFGLDVCQYLSLPHLGFDCMLKKTDVKLELIWDQEMSDLLKKNIRGGLSYVNTRYANNNEGAIIYIDANNLYGKAMTFPLPHHSFRWMSAEEVAEFDVFRHVHMNEGDGYILEVDLEYPSELHLQHNAYPLAPETKHIDEMDLSLYSKRCLKAIYNKKKYNSRKLTATFRPRLVNYIYILKMRRDAFIIRLFLFYRLRYLVHGINLSLYLKLGMKLKKIHRIITFHQSYFLTPFIQECTEKRMKATSASEQNMWKLICNSVYGKVR